MYLCIRLHFCVLDIMYFYKCRFMTRYMHKINKRNLCIGKYIGLTNNWKTFLTIMIVISKYHDISTSFRENIYNITTEASEFSQSAKHISLS